jgi:hypothetical protein
MSLARIRLLFLISGLYDVLIALAFLAFGGPLLERAGIPQPNHWGYLQFAALELLIFGSMFLAVGRDPIRNGNLIVYGLMLKVSYVGLVGYYWARGECPLLFQPFAVIDAAMFVLFLWAYSGLRSRDVLSSRESV